MIVTIILQCFNGIWSYQTLANGQLVNFGSGYFTPELAMIQAQIFTSTLPDGTAFTLPRYVHVHPNERKTDGKATD